jgi:broad-specificity NMP kinase
MIIGISGTRCVGKDTACKLLNKFQNYARFAFADAFWIESTLVLTLPIPK